MIASGPRLFKEKKILRNKNINININNSPISGMEMFRKCVRKKKKYGRKNTPRKKEKEKR